MDVNSRDFDEYVGCEVIAGNKTATSAGGGDNTEVEGAMIDADAYSSGIILIQVQTNLTATKTLSFTINADSAATNTNVSTTTDVEVLAKTVVATGADSSVNTAVQVPVSGDVLKVSSKRYIHFDITPDLSQTNGDDNCTWSAAFIGLKRSMS